ncbi:MAG: metallopeptidase family protein [Anaerolineae bacterium]
MTRKRRRAKISRASFEQLVAEALDGLPPDILRLMDNVDVVVEGWPTWQHLAEAGLGPGQTLFGLYQGIPLTKRTESYGLVLPDKITIFQGPIEAWCRSEAEIRRQVQQTVVHEMAHHFGISDERLRELGW